MHSVPTIVIKNNYGTAGELGPEVLDGRTLREREIHINRQIRHIVDFDRTESVGNPATDQLGAGVWRKVLLRNLVALRIETLVDLGPAPAETAEFKDTLMGRHLFIRHAAVGVEQPEVLVELV